MCSDKLEWTSHPWAEDALARKVSMVALTAAASLIAADSFDSAWIGLVSAAALAGSMSRYLAPSRYELTDEGIRIAHLGMSRFHPWSRFRRVVRRRDGVFLGTFDVPSRLDIWRGCFLRCPRGLDEAYEYVREHVVVGPDQGARRPRSGHAAAS